MSHTFKPESVTDCSGNTEVRGFNISGFPWIHGFEFRGELQDLDDDLQNKQLALSGFRIMWLETSFHQSTLPR
jgi:hypothetical protein